MDIILDRDGVINEESPFYIKSPEEWIPIPKSLEAIASLKNAGYRIFVATNQSGIARGLYTEEVLEKIHQKMAEHLAKLGASIDGIFYCPHHPNDGCDCRKPRPGLLLAIAKKFQVDLSKTLYIGDSLRDFQAAQKVGAKFSLVLTGNGKKTLAENKLDTPIYADLFSLVNDLLK